MLEERVIDQTRNDDPRPIFHVLKYKWERVANQGAVQRTHELTHDGEEVAVNADSKEEAAQIVCQCEVEEAVNPNDLLCKVWKRGPHVEQRWFRRKR
jgi:hypothetical protein